MLVAVAVLMVLMAGFTMLFTGSVRTVKTAMQQADASDRATGALASIKADLLTSFNGRDAGAPFSFYGTPIGMTFVGLVKNRSEWAGYNTDATALENTDLRLARVTYVLHHHPAGRYDIPGFEVFDGALEGADGYSHRLLRYVEPNAADLDTFPVNWDTTLSSEGFTLSELIDAEWDSFEAAYPGEYSDSYQESFRRAKKCEIWIRMLAGGDEWNGVPVPDAWRNPEAYLGRGPEDLPQDGTAFLQFVLTDAVTTTVPPFALPEFAMASYREFPFSGPALFSYDHARPLDEGVASCYWWNDVVHYTECQSPDASYFQPALPEVVSLNIWLMFKSPYPSAPDYQKLFTMQVDVRAAYARQVVISGLVYNYDTGAPRANVPMDVKPYTGSPITTDANGYYFVTLPNGWTGEITPVGVVACNETDNNDCVPSRLYTNVTTAIENQNYAVVQ